MNKFLSSAYGALLGDCIGAFNEFNYGKKIRKLDLNVIKTQKDSHEHMFGHWTDDTTMALITMDVMNKNGFMHLDEIRYDFLCWYYDGHMSSTKSCFDIGGTVVSSLLKKEFKDIPSNGAIMRIYPAAFFTYGLSYDIKKDLVTKLAEITHCNKVSTEYCLYFTDVIHDIISGCDKETIYKRYKHFMAESNTNPTGSVMNSFKLAFSEFINADSFMEGVMNLANLGGDSDTICCIYGAMAGCYHGLDDVPEWMFGRISKHVKVRSIFDHFNKMCVVK